VAGSGVSVPPFWPLEGVLLSTAVVLGAEEPLAAAEEVASLVPLAPAPSETEGGAVGAALLLSAKEALGLRSDGDGMAVAVPGAAMLTVGHGEVDAGSVCSGVSVAQGEALEREVMLAATREGVGGAVALTTSLAEAEPEPGHEVGETLGVALEVASAL
jgi:hypothetical protein